MTKKPKLLFIAPSFGVHSEVWLYRQATMVNELDVHVLCYQHQNQEHYPAQRCAVTELHPTRNLISQRWQTTKRMIKRRLLSADSYFKNDFDSSIWDKIVKTEFNTCLIQYGTMACRFVERVQRAGIPYAIHFNGFDLSKKINDPQYIRRLKPALKSASVLIVVAEYMRDWLIQQGVERDKVKYLPYGVPLERFQVGPKDSQLCQFLMVGRLTPKKAPKSTIQAFAQCYRQFPNSRLRIVGDGELQAECEALVQQLQIGSAVNFLGAQPTEVVQHELASADVFLQHSITPTSGDREGWPVAIAEAAASGLPIVSTRHASIPEQVIDGETGFLVAEHDWNAMADKMAILAGNSEKRRVMGGKSRTHIASWDSKKQISQLEQILLSIRKR